MLTSSLPSRRIEPRTILHGASISPGSNRPATDVPDSLSTTRPSIWFGCNRNDTSFRRAVLAFLLRQRAIADGLRAKMLGCRCYGGLSAHKQVRGARRET